MYSVTQDCIDAYRSNMNVAVSIQMNGGAIMITDADIALGSMTFSRSSTTGSGIEFGSVNASQLKFRILNTEGTYDNVTFAGADLSVSISVSDGTVDYVIPMGHYVIDNSPKILKTIDIEALDRMTRFDKEFIPSNYNWENTDVASLLTALCTDCGVTLETDVQTLTNKSYAISSAPEGYTCRQILAWLCEITGTCAYFDWNGFLRLEWYGNASYTVTPSERFTSSLENYIVAYTGVSVENGENSGFSGDEGYVLAIENNELITHDFNTIAGSLLTKLQAVPYIPCTMKIMPAPYIYPLDILTYEDADLSTYNVVVTDCEYTVGSLSLIEGKGESPEEMGYASVNPFTSRERVIMKKLSQEINNVINTRVQTVSDFNNLITNSLGLFYTDVPQPNGSVIRYMHDQPVLADSMQIYTLTANGIAWTNDGWNNGDPVWTYGATSAGFALFKRLSAEGIDVESAGTNYHVEITPRSFIISYLNTEVVKIVADTMVIPRIKAAEYVNIGAIRFSAAYSNGDLIGTNIYWTGG